MDGEPAVAVERRLVVTCCTLAVVQVSTVVGVRREFWFFYIPK